MAAGREREAQPDIGQRLHMADRDADEEEGAAPDHGQAEQDQPVAAVHLRSDHRRLVDVGRTGGVRAIALELGRLDRLHSAGLLTVAAGSHGQQMPDRQPISWAYQSRSSSLMLVFERVRSSTRLTITAQASAGPPSLPGRAPGTTTEYSGTRP